MPPVNTPEEGLPPPRTDLAILQANLPDPSSSAPTSAHPTPIGSRPASGRATPVSPPAADPQRASTPAIVYQELDYINPVDDVLLCPICKTPFDRPITTKGCGHTFCTDCLRRSYEIQPICPIDRARLSFPRDVCPTRVIADQVDRLPVRCPNRGCGHVCARDELKAHYERDCENTLVPCPVEGCDKLVTRVDATPANGCLHARSTACRYCDEKIVVADLESHYDTACLNNTVKCPKCDAVRVKSRLAKHTLMECPEEVTQCRWKRFGCRVDDKRKVVQAHEAECVYEAIGQLKMNSEEDRRVIMDLRGEVASLRRELRKRPPAPPSFMRPSMDSFIPDLDLAGVPTTGSSATSPRTAPVPYSGVAPHVATLGGPAVPPGWEPSDEYLLAQYERMATDYEDLRKMITEMDARHSMMLLNENLLIKDQLAELRSNLGVIGMHTTWLMNMVRQNRGLQQQRPDAMSTAAAGAVSSAAAAGSGAGSTGRPMTTQSRGDDDISTHSFGPSRRSSGEQAPRL